MIFNPCKKCLVRSTCDTKCEKLKKHIKFFNEASWTFLCMLSLIIDGLFIYLLYLVAGSYTKWILLGIVVIIILSALSIETDEDDFMSILFMAIITLTLPIFLICSLTDLLDNFDEIPYRYINSNRK